MRRIEVHELMDRFIRDTYPEPNTGCWIWGGGVNVDGYGVMKCVTLPKETRSAHRASYFLHNGPFDYSLQVLHRCDNPPCVNPDHLFLGTHQDNMNDRKLKGRTNKICPKGSKCASSKLDENKVLEIRKISGKTQREIGQIYGLTQSSIHFILSRKTWTHV